MQLPMPFLRKPMASSSKKPSFIKSIKLARSLTLRFRMVNLLELRASRSMNECVSKSSTALPNWCKNKPTLSIQGLISQISCMGIVDQTEKSSRSRDCPQRHIRSLRSIKLFLLWELLCYRFPSFFPLTDSIQIHHQVCFMCGHSIPNK